VMSCIEGLSTMLIETARLLQTRTLQRQNRNVQEIDLKISKVKLVL
jgi:hypothetical protein